MSWETWAVTGLVLLLIIIVLATVVYFIFKKKKKSDTITITCNRTTPPIPTNDTYNINKFNGSVIPAVNAASKAKGTVIIPTGTFNLTSTDISSAANFSIYLTGTVNGDFNFTNCSNIAIYGTGAINGKIVFRNCKCVSISQVTLSSPSQNIIVDNSSSFSLHDFSIVSGTDAIQLINTTDEIIINTVNIKCTGDALSVNNTASNISMNYTNITSGNGISVSGTVRRLYFSNDNLSNTQFGLKVNTTSLSTLRFQFITMKNILQFPLSFVSNSGSLTDIKLQNIKSDTSKFADTFNFSSTSDLEDPILLDNIVFTNVSDNSLSSNIVKNAKFSIKPPVTGMVGIN